MPLWFIVVADLALLYLFFGHSLHYRLLPKRRQQRAALKASERHLAHLLHRDRDLLPEEKRQKIEAVLATLREALASGDDGRIALAAKRYGKYDPVTPSSSESFLKSLADVLFFILMLAFGARALFIQPFKIPTSSMEPTLYGIHFQALPAEAVPDNPLRQAFDWANLSRRYVRETVSQDGEVRKELSDDLYFRIDHRHFVWNTFLEAHNLPELCDTLYEEKDWRWVAPADLLESLSDLPLTPAMAYALSFLGTEPLSYGTFGSLSGLGEEDAARLLMTLWGLGGLRLVEGAILRPAARPSSSARA